MSESALLANLNPLSNNKGLALMNHFPPKNLPAYLAEFSMAVFLSLWDMENLVHVRLSLLPSDSGEQQAGDQKVGAAESSEDVAFKSIHV